MCPLPRFGKLQYQPSNEHQLKFVFPCHPHPTNSQLASHYQQLRNSMGGPCIATTYIPIPSSLLIKIYFCSRTFKSSMLFGVQLENILNRGLQTNIQEFLAQIEVSQKLSVVVWCILNLWHPFLSRRGCAVDGVIYDNNLNNFSCLMFIPT